MMSTGLKYILVDDDDFCNIISSMMLEDAFGEVDVKAFNRPIEALEFIEKEYTKNTAPTILFLDINMPMIDGWQFLERFENFNDEVKQQIKIYMLSSSVNQQDIKKAAANKNVESFLSKPLDLATLTTISEKKF